MRTRRWSAALFLGLALGGLVACGGGSTAPTPTAVPQQDTPTAAATLPPAATATPAPAPTPTPWPISIPPNVTLDLDPSLTATELAYLRQTISDALRQASIDFGMPVPTFTLFAYRSPETLVAKRAGWRGETPEQSSQKFPCDFCAETDTGVVLLRLGDGWFADSEFPRHHPGRAVVTHEIYHIYQLVALGGKNYDAARGPAWLLEGSAQWLAYRLVATELNVPWESVLHAASAAAVRGTAPLEDMEGLGSFVSSANPYAVGLLAVERLLGGRSPTGIAAFYQRLGKGADWRLAFESTFAQTTTAFYESFAAYRQTLPPGSTPTPTVTALATISGTLSGPGTTLSTPVTVRACLLADANQCWPATLAGAAFTVTAPPGRYILSVSRGQVLLGYHRADGLTKDRASAIVIDTTAASVSGVTVIVP